VTEAVIVSTARTPIGRAFRGAFNDTHAADLARLHGTDERIATANLAELVRFYHQLLRNLNAPAP